MTRKHKAPHAHVETPEPTPPPAGPPAAPPPPPAAESPEEAVKRLAAEAEQWKDQYLRLAADMDNFRKRVQKERTESWSRAQAELVSRVLDALDDLGRVAHLDPEKTSSRDLAAGVDLVERKMLKQFEAAGLMRIGAPGEKFDPAGHEAVSTVPAAAPEQDHTVAAVFQSGFTFAGTLLRPARVQVFIWQEAPTAEGAGAPADG